VVAAVGAGVDGSMSAAVGAIVDGLVVASALIKATVFLVSFFYPSLWR